MPAHRQSLSGWGGGVGVQNRCSSTVCLNIKCEIIFVRFCGFSEKQCHFKIKSKNLNWSESRLEKSLKWTKESEFWTRCGQHFATLLLILSRRWIIFWLVRHLINQERAGSISFFYVLFASEVQRSKPIFFLPDSGSNINSGELWESISGENWNNRKVRCVAGCKKFT